MRLSENMWRGWPVRATVRRCCVAGDFNSHIGVVEPGDEESMGRFGRGTRNSERRELVEMLRSNW